MEPVGHPVSWDGHLALVHRGEPERRAGVAAWVRRGLDLGAKILYIEPPQESAERSFMALMRDTDVAVDEAVESGQLEVLPADDGAYSSSWQAGVVDAALADGYPAVRWSGEAITAWSVMSPSAHADIEWATDDLCRTRPVSILCQYSAKLPPTALQAVCAMHGGGVRESMLQTSPSPGGIALAGEVDASNERVLLSALLAATARARHTSFVVDLGRLDFLDVAGVRALLAGTRAYRRDGGSVCLRAARRPVEPILRLLDVDRAEGVRVVEGP